MITCSCAALTNQGCAPVISASSTAIRSAFLLRAPLGSQCFDRFRPQLPARLRIPATGS
jgi:hypothetical protein